jgi:outer membrane murein-binding lipoprotein Lpp
VLLGAYWVLYPGNPTARADAFLARLDAACPGWRDRPFILQADCEKWNGNGSTVPARAEIQAFCDRLQNRVPKLKPIVYAPRWVYGDSLASLGFPLWASSYVTGSGGFKALYPGDSSSKWGAYSGQTPAILQYTSSATIGGQTTCDANAFRGTFDDLMALVAPGWSDNMPTAEDIAKAVWEYPLTNPYSSAVQQAGTILRYAPSATPTQQVSNKVDALAAKVAALSTPTVDVSALASDLLAALESSGGVLTQAGVETALRNVLHGA